MSEETSNVIRIRNDFLNFYRLMRKISQYLWKFILPLFLLSYFVVSYITNLFGPVTPLTRNPSLLFLHNISSVFFFLAGFPATFFLYSHNFLLLPFLLLGLYIFDSAINLLPQKIWWTKFVIIGLYYYMSIEFIIFNELSP